MFSTNVVLFPINVISSVSVKLLYEQEVFHFFFFCDFWFI